MYLITFRTLCLIRFGHYKKLGCGVKWSEAKWTNDAKVEKGIGGIRGEVETWEKEKRKETLKEKRRNRLEQKLKWIGAIEM
jgi:hypothetical protein